MTYTVLDIGAGSSAFGRDLVRWNRSVPMSVFCGEPWWFFPRPISETRKQRILARGLRGIWRVTSRYSEFGFPDESLDLVTLNAPHPFTAPDSSFLNELDRCLKPGGLFFSSFPRWSLVEPRHFSLLIEGAWKQGGKEGGRMLQQDYPDVAPTAFPCSPCIMSNIVTHRYGDARSYGSSYIYWDGISPGYKVWRKPL